MSSIFKNTSVSFFQNFWKTLFIIQNQFQFVCQLERKASEITAFLLHTHTNAQTFWSPLIFGDLFYTENDACKTRLKTNLLHSIHDVSGYNQIFL